MAKGFSKLSSLFGANNAKSSTAPTIISPNTTQNIVSSTTSTISKSNNDFEVVGCILKKYNGTLSVVSIPPELHITSIAQRAFANCKSLIQLKIPNGVTSIGDRAFSSCENLTHISIPDTITNIGNYAFENCKKLEGLALPNDIISVGNYLFSGCKSLSSVTLSDNLKAISNYMFFKCESLTELIIPNKVTGIGSKAFSGCSSLINIAFPNKLTTLGNYSFENCTSLKTIALSENIKNIGEGIFFACENLETINLSPSNQFFSSEDGVLFNQDKTKLYTYPSKLNDKTHYDIPSSVHTITFGAFSYCKSLTSISVPDSVTTLDSSIFQSCTSLSTMELPESLTSFGKNLFNKCSNLTYVKLPSKLTSIEYGTFYECTMLNNITLPDNISTIGDFSFFACRSLSSIDFPVNLNSLGKNAFCDCDSLKTINIGTNLSSIGKGCFSNCKSLSAFKVADDNISFASNDNILYSKNLELLHTYPANKPDKKFSILDKVTTISDQAFQGCQNLETIALSSHVLNITMSTFSDCINLKDVMIKDGTISIDTFAFSKCVNLEYITIPNSVTKIDSNTFLNCTKVSFRCNPNSYAYQYALENNISFAQSNNNTVSSINENLTLPKEPLPIIEEPLNTTALETSSSTITTNSTPIEPVVSAKSDQNIIFNTTIKNNNAPIQPVLPTNTKSETTACSISNTHSDFKQTNPASLNTTHHQHIQPASEHKPPVAINRLNQALLKNSTNINHTNTNFNHTNSTPKVEKHYGKALPILDIPKTAKTIASSEYEMTPAINTLSITGIETKPNTSNSVLITWDSIDNAVEYHLLLFNQDTSEFDNVTKSKTSKAIVTGIVPGITQQYKIVAYKLEDNEKVPFLSSKPIFVGTTLPPVTGFKCTNTTSTSITLEWDQLKDCIKYIIYAYKITEQKFVPIEETHKNSITINNLKSGTTLRLKIAVVRLVQKAECTSTLSDELVATTEMSNVKGLIMASRTSTSIKLNWISMTGIAEYKIYQLNNTTNMYEEIATTKNNNITLQNLLPNTYYKYQVKACKIVNGKNIFSPPSNIYCSTSTA